MAEEYEVIHDWEPEVLHDRYILSYEYLIGLCM
jgi:FK506-binding protein 1